MFLKLVHWLSVLELAGEGSDLTAVYFPLVRQPGPYEILSSHNFLLDVCRGAAAPRGSQLKYSVFYIKKKKNNSKICQNVYSRSSRFDGFSHFGRGLYNNCNLSRPGRRRKNPWFSPSIIIIITKSPEPLTSGSLFVSASLVSSQVTVRRNTNTNTICNTEKYIFDLLVVTLPGLEYYLTPPASSSAGEFLSSSWLSGLERGLSRGHRPATPRLSR